MAVSNEQKQKAWYFVSIVVLLTLGIFFWRPIAGKIHLALYASSQETQFKQDVDDCKKAQALKKSGLSEPDCVVKYAAYKYNTDPERALNLCAKYSLLNIQSEDLARRMCKKQILESIAQQDEGDSRITLPPKIISPNIQRTLEQNTAWQKCEQSKGIPRLELSMESGREEVFCSFGERGECTQNELNKNGCNIK